MYEYYIEKNPTLFCILIKLSTQISGFAMYGKISYGLALI